MKLVVSTVRPARAGWADAPCQEWGKRIQRYFPYEERIVRPSDADGEAEQLFATVPSRGRLVAVDERGDALTSPELATLLERCAQDGTTTLVFAIGGAHGHAPSVRARAWKSLSLSRMVLAHQVARVVLVEQVYRACTIRAGEPYHHA